MSTNQIDLMKLFQQIKWAENGDTVDFPETNYSTGWSFLGDDTPTVEDFNALQQWNDKKDQWLYGQIAEVCKDQGIAVTENDLNALLKAIKKIAKQPQATTGQIGVTQLDSSTNSTSETKAATPKAVKIVKDLIDALTRNLASYIPNSKKSNSVASTSSDTVATSYAVKQAYDKGVSAQNSANSANNNANGRVSKLGDTMTGHLEIKASDWSAVKLWNTANKSLILEVRPDTETNYFGNLIYRTESGSNVAVLNIPRKTGELAVLGEVVRKSGDTMTGVLTIDRQSSYIVGRYGSQAKWYVGKGSDNSDNIRLHSYVYNYGVELQSNRLVSGKPIYINNDPVVYEKTDRITNLNSLTGSLFFKCDGTTTGMPSGWERNSDHNGFQVDGGWQRFQVVVQNENKIAIRVNDSNGDATSWSAWSHFITEGNFQDKLRAEITQNLGQNGWCKLPNGLIQQWGWSDSEDVRFPIAFPSECFVVSHSKTGGGRDTRIANISRTGFSSRSSGGTGRTYYVAIGR